MHLDCVCVLAPPMLLFKLSTTKVTILVTSRSPFPHNHHTPLPYPKYSLSPGSHLSHTLFVGRCHDQTRSPLLLHFGATRHVPIPDSVEYLEECIVQKRPSEMSALITAEREWSNVGFITLASPIPLALLTCIKPALACEVLRSRHLNCPNWHAHA